MPEPTRTIVLAKWHDAWVDKCLPPLFAEMVKLAFPIVENYLGDLFHDALWLNEEFAKDLREGSNQEGFYFSCNHNGTLVAHDIRTVEHRPENIWYFLVRLSFENGATSGPWFADITQVSQ